MCLVAMQQHTPGAMRCPCCRRNVTALFRLNEHGAQGAECTQVDSMVATYNRRAAGVVRTPADMLQDLPVLLERALAAFLSQGLPIFVRIRIFLYVLMGLVYILSPIDLLPEVRRCCCCCAC
jgi:hypothetical protein